MQWVRDIQRFRTIPNTIIMCVCVFLEYYATNLLMNLHYKSNFCVSIASSSCLDVQIWLEFAENVEIIHHKSEI